MRVTDVARDGIGVRQPMGQAVSWRDAFLLDDLRGCCVGGLLLKYITY